MDANTSCLEAWQAADLPNVQLSLDDQAGEIAAHGQDSNVRRRELARATREFKSGLSSDVSPGFTKLLKCYQEEVDKLTKRAKFGETCFLTIYRVVRELPDPVEELNAASKRVFDAESFVVEAEERVKGESREVEKVRRELAEREEELERLKSNSVETNDETAVLKKQLEDMKAKHEQEVAELASRAEDQLAGMTLELEIAQQEAEKQSAVLLELQEQSKELDATLAAKITNEKTMNDLRLEIAQLKHKNTTLQDECTDVTAQVSRIQAENARLRLSETNGSELQGKIGEMQKTVDSLTAQLQNAPKQEEYSRLRHQLLVMQRTLYNSTEDETNDGKEEEIKLDGLEEWLLKSNKGLKDQVMTLREQLTEKDSELNRVREAETKLTEALQHQSELSEQLERDLVSFETSKQADTSSPDIATNPGSRTRQPNDKALQSLLEAVCAQRERLRSTVAKKDATIGNLEKSLRLTTMKLNSLEEDNVDLFKRIKFLQSYKVSERSTLLPGIQSLEEGQGNESRGLGRGVEHKYRRIYEAVDNPWGSFQEKERNRAEGSMSLAERLALRTFNPFLTRRRGRVCLLYYTVVIHLVFLYYVVACKAS